MSAPENDTPRGGSYAGHYKSSTLQVDHSNNARKDRKSTLLPTPNYFYNLDTMDQENGDQDTINFGLHSNSEISTRRAKQLTPIGGFAQFTGSGIDYDHQFKQPLIVSNEDGTSEVVDLQSNKISHNETENNREKLQQLLNTKLEHQQFHIAKLDRSLLPNSKILDLDNPLTLHGRYDNWTDQRKKMEAMNIALTLSAGEILYDYMTFIDLL